MGIFDKIFSKTKVDPKEYNDKLNEAVVVGRMIQDLRERKDGYFIIDWVSKYVMDMVENGDYTLLNARRKNSQYIYFRVATEIYGEYYFDKYNNESGLTFEERENLKKEYLSFMFQKPYDEIPPQLVAILYGEHDGLYLNWECSCPLPSGMQGEKDCERFIRDIKSRLGIK
ncbi:MAG: hypothetical protein IKA56_02005 [Clostridia bacterium]|nr:hypothetical protein [Clostridia bacterium]